jgi:hypothetical protein
MNTASEGQWQERDDTAEDAPVPRDAGSRRRLLSGAAGGLALATSGLLLPDWLVEEAEADNHPVRRVQDRKEKKRQKFRNQLERRHHKSRRNGGQESSSPGIIQLGIQFLVGATDGPHWVELYRHADFFSDKLELADAQNISPSPYQVPLNMRTDDQFGALWIDGRYYFAAVNYIGPGMLEWAGVGGRLPLDKGWVDGQLGFKGELKETTRTIEGSAPVITDDHTYVHFLRRPDNKLYKQFEILFQPRP